MKRISFNRPFVADVAYEHIRRAVANGHLSGDGPYTRRCHEWLERELGIGRALLTTSCTHAMELAALLLRLQPGDEVIVPSFTFVSTANAFVLHGATPIFVDIRPDTMNLDEELLESAITRRTRAIVVVHYAGISCEMARIAGIADRHGIAVVEDTAHGLFGAYHGRPLGSFGCLSALSFHETKNLSCGEGGALLINDEGFVERAEILREKGTDRSRFFRGEIDKYSWVDVGSSYLPSDLLAAVLYSQLEIADEIQARRKRIWTTYLDQLQTWAADRGVQLPTVPEHCENPYHLFYLVMPSLEHRQALIRHLDSRGVHAVFHYVPLHLSEMGRRFSKGASAFPVTERVAEGLVRLPFYNEMTQSDQAQVIDAVRTFPGSAE